MKPNSLAITNPLKILCLVCVFALSELFAPAADNYTGAGAVLKKIAEQGAQPDEKKETTNESARLKAELTSFREASPGMAPADAAKRWLEFVDRAAKIQPDNARGYQMMRARIGPDDLLAALPPPAAWDDLARAIAARPAAKGSAEIRQLGLQLLAAALKGDADARQRVVAALQAKAASADQETGYMFRNVLNEINQATLTASDDPEAVLKSLERQLTSGRETGTQQLTIPNLVSIAGPAKAEAFLRRALVQRNIILAFNSQNETSRLAQKLAMELMDKINTPQWGLVNSLDSIALYEALDKKFSKPASDDDDAGPMSFPGGGGDYRKVQAQAYYFYGLIGNGRTSDAIAVAKKMGNQQQGYLSEQALKTMEHAGHTTDLDNFFYELLSGDPTLPFWDEYVPLAVQAGKSDRMLALARKTAASPDLAAGKKVKIRETLFRALLAADQADEAVQEIRQLMAATSPGRNMENMNSGQLGITLAQIGMLLEKTNWVDEGIAAAKKWLETGGQQETESWQYPGTVHGLVTILADLGRGPEAEAILTDALARQAHKSGDREEPSAYYGEGGGKSTQLLIDLALLYHKAGRHEDVLVLFEQAPYWEVRDLNDLFGHSLGGQIQLARSHTPGATVSLADIAAKALLATGRRDEALKITQAILDREPGLDRGYELLLALNGTNSIARLDELFARDPFEERPLIWKAHLLRQQGRLEEAEKIARQAIAVDPSDGEEGPGDRMRAYSELADIREARGDKKDADLYHGAVKAIRMSENADRYYMSGLVKRAIRMYEESLLSFADAYCIQSRLAIQLSDLGLHEEAEEHYRRAYELMPDSFGRVESHCFGCERAFDGERAQSLAEKVFTKAAGEHPQKPQVHYLLGYLREEQERYNEALTNFLTAVKLDPDYLNAWVRIQGMGENVLMSPARRDEVALNILRLDPANRHGCASFSDVVNLPALWKAVEATSKRQPPKTTAIFTLTASKAALENRKESKSDLERRMNVEEMRSDLVAITPARAVAQTAFVRIAGQLLANENSELIDP